MAMPAATTEVMLGSATNVLQLGTVIVMLPWICWLVFEDFVFEGSVEGGPLPEAFVPVVFVLPPPETQPETQLPETPVETLGILRATVSAAILAWYLFTSSGYRLASSSKAMAWLIAVALGGMVHGSCLPRKSSLHIHSMKYPE